MSQKIQIRRGLKSQLPSEAASGEPLYATDTKEFFIGNDPGNPVTQIVTDSVNGGEFGESVEVNSNSSIEQNNYAGTTLDDVETEIFLGGVDLNRLVIDANSAASFTMQVIAKNNVDDVAKMWTVEGAFKRGGSSPSMVGSVYTVAATQDGAYDTSFNTDNWTISITVDSVNNSLKMTVTGEAGKTIRWLSRTILAKVTF